MFKKTIVKESGLRIITIPMKNIQTVTALVLIGVGSKYETKQNNGISHFLEHMFFKGTKKRKNALEVAETLDKIGGAYNAFTGEEYTGYWAKSDLKNLDLILDWVSDIYLNSKLEQKEINKEKGVIIEEMNMYFDNPMSYIETLWEELLYGNQPAGWPIIGSKKNVLSFNKKDFLDYRNNHYSSKNTIVCLAGNIDPKDAEKKVKKYFKNIKSFVPDTKLEVIEKQDNPRLLVHYKKTDQTHLALGVRAYSLFDKKRYAQAILANILGGYMSSRLFVSIREKRGLAYYVTTISDSNSDTGCLVTRVGADSENIEKVISLILKEYKELKNIKISKQELKKAKDNIRGKMYLSLESSNAQASFYAGQELLTQEILTPEQKLTEIDKVSILDIQNLTKDIFKLENLNLALIGPFKEKERFQKLLRI